MLLNITSFALGARSVDPGIMVQVIFTGDWSLPVKEAETTMRLSRSSPPIRPRLNSALMVSFPASHDLFCVMMVQSAGNEGRRDSRSCIFKDVKFTSRGSFRLTAHTSTEKCREAGRRARLNNGRPLAEARGAFDDPAFVSRFARLRLDLYDLGRESLKSRQWTALR